jgi:hypothetical protein
MYARIDPFTAEQGTENGIGGPVPDTPGLRGSMTLSELSGPAGAVLTVWDNRTSAVSYPEAPGQAARGYDVVDIGAGPAAGVPPTHAALLYFDGPEAPEKAVAAEFAWRQRIWPAIAELPGLVAVCALRQDEPGTLIIHLGTSLAALETVGQTVMSTQLLPGEDPALLPGPDRIAFHRVANYAMSVRTEPTANR